MTAEIKLLDSIAPESKVYPLFAKDSGSAEEKFERPIEHVVNFVTIKNSSFASSLFAYRGQQLLLFNRNKGFVTLGNADKMKWIQSLDGYDYVWAYGVPQTVSDELEKLAELVTDSGKTKIWKLNK
jgi:hypothetical protein